MKPRSRYRGLTLFVTVGSTRFDKLIERILTEECASQLTALGFSRLILQLGSSKYDQQLVDKIRDEYELEIEIYDYKNSIHDDINRSDVIVGHAGAGTCLEVLRMNKRLLIVVNEDLMDNHQNELAEQLADDRYAFKTNVDELSKSLAHICDIDTKILAKFPSQERSKFEEIFDEALKKTSPRL